MIYTDIEQKSADWYAMRCGCVTSSRLNDVVAKLKRKDGEAAARANYRKELAIERLTGNTYDHYVSPYMEWGTENEPLARTEYELLTGNTVTSIGGALHDSIKYFWASTDSLVNDDGILEIKCPTSINHLDVWVSGEIPEEYHWQMLGGMACTGRQWCDFVSFDPRMPEELRLFVKRFPRNDALVRAAELEVGQFLKEVDEMVTKLKELGSGRLVAG